MDNVLRLTDIAAYRAALTNVEKAKVDYVVANVAGIEVEHVREMIEAGYSLDQIKEAVSGARQEENTATVEVLLVDETGATIRVSVSPEQYERINAMSQERKHVLAKTLRQRAAAKEREERAAQREREREQEGMTKRQKEEADNDGWRITKRFAKDNQPKIVAHRKSSTRVVTSRAAVIHWCDLPSCREAIEPGENYLRVEVARPHRNSSRRYIPDVEVYHEGCLGLRALEYTPALKLLGLENTPVRQPQESRLPSTSPSQQLKGVGQAVSDALTQGLLSQADAVRLGIVTRDDLGLAKERQRPQRDIKNIVIHHTEPSGPPEAQAHYWVDKNNASRRVY